MILSRYLMRAFIGRFVMLLVGLVFFLQTLDLLATANEVLAGGGPPMASLARYISLRMPGLVETVAPLAALLGALTAMVAMATNSEILAMRAAGRSVLSLVGGLVSVGLILSAALFMFSEFIVVRANGELQAWRDADFKTGDAPVQNAENSWIREGNTILRIGKVLRDGTVLQDMRIFKQDANGNIADILAIRLALWENDHWSAVEVTRVAGMAPDSDVPLTWETQLKPEHFFRMASQHPNELSLNALQQYIGTVAIGSRPGYFYDTWLQQKIAGPIVLALMPLLAAIAAFAHHRQGSSVVTVVWGISIGFAFVVIDNIVLAMGQFGSLPPMMAAWLPIGLFGTLGLWLIFNLEHTGART